MYINISDSIRINVDGRNYAPEFFRKGGEVKVVAGKEHLTKDEWRSYGKFYSSLGLAVAFVVRQTAIESAEEMTLAEYVERLEATEKRVLEALPEVSNIN